MTNLQDFTNRSEVGTIKPWGKTTAPSGYLLCDGTAVSRTTYAELFVVLSTTYGVGDGSTTFNVPQLQGKTPQGYDGNTYNLAGTGGANTVTVAVTNNQAATNTVTNNQAVTVTGSISNTSLTEAQLGSHDHSFGLALSTDTSAPYQTIIAGGRNQSGNLGTPNTSNAGSGTGHTHAHTLAGTLTGTVAATTALTGTVTAAGNNTFSPYVVVNYIIKH
jgi:microcystin-dependent protein